MKKRKVIPIIECSGSEYEIGRQYGEQARGNLRKSVSLMYRSLEQMPYRADRKALPGAARKYLDNVRAFDAGALERVKGMSEGAGISFDEALALQCYTEIFVNYPGLSGMCTSFAATGPATRDGVTILGQNVDWHPDATIDLVRIKKPDGARMLGLFLSGYGCYYLTSHMLGNCANLTLCPLGPVVNHVPFAFSLYAAMGRKSVKDALAVLSETARGIGYFHLADGQGALAGIESIYDDYTIIEPTNGVLVHANHYETEKYKKTDGAAVFIKDSFGRADRLRERIAAFHGSLTPELMMELLQDHSCHPDSICRHVDPAKQPVFASLSLASLIMVPKEGKIFISCGPPCENEYVEYRV